MLSTKVRKNPLLAPLSAIYGLIVWLRNYFFDKGWIKSEKFDLPVICVGNLAVGGTGKTPHVEYLLGLLRHTHHTAVLSRGYKRKTKGFLLASPESTADDIGDEPYQMLSKFPDVTVAVDAKRVRGIRKLLSLFPIKPVEVVVLDDAYQHRYVKPGISILLTDCNRLFTDDCLLPAGRLREPAMEKERANIIIVTKCPPDIQPFDVRVLRKKINARPYQKLFLTTVKYGRKYPLFPSEEKSRIVLNKQTKALIVAGVANPDGFVAEMEKTVSIHDTLIFPDHHRFGRSDAYRINKVFAEIADERKVILTTEKDACRLLDTPGLSHEVRRAIIVQPIEIDFLEQGQNTFNNIILNYVRKNQRNSGVAQS